ncbi:MAG: hypothetical protein KF847_10065 [Pirellulales bacterium]|nr:hypothetical protein [Pirellulales bacterium]
MMRLARAFLTANVTVICMAAQMAAQTKIDWIGPVGVEAAYDVGDLGGGEGTFWRNPGPPEALFQPLNSFGEYGSISNGGIALIDHAITVPPADLRIAETAGSTGSLVIRNGGSLTVQTGTAGTGTLANGGAGAGKLTLRDNMGSVSVERYTQNAASTLVTQLSAAGTFANRVTASSDIALDGTLRLERAPGSNFTAAAGNTWTIMQSPVITGSFDAIEVDPALRSNSGQVFASSRTGGNLTVSVEQRLVLQVNRFTGAANLLNPSGHVVSIPLISYTLASPNNGVASMNSRWTSFQDAAAAGDASLAGWQEANPSGTHLSELNATGTLTMSPGQTRSFSTPVNANASAPLGTNRVVTSDISFRYQSPTGQILDAVIEPVGRINDLVLVVNPANGQATIQNQSSQNLSFISYTISSASGSLNTSFTGFQGASVANWSKANPTLFNLSELNTTAAASMSPGGEQALGTVWNFSTGSRDLTFKYQTTDGTLHTGTVDYGSKAIVTSDNADFNSSNFVDGTDFLAWQRGFGLTGQPNKSTGDANGDGAVNGADLTIWKSQFGTTPSAAPLITSVPEPSAGLLAMLALSAFPHALIRCRSIALARRK